MKEMILFYRAEGHSFESRADITVFEPNELSIYPGLQVVVITEPRHHEGLSVTNGSEQIATELMWHHGIGPFGTAYIEHYRDFVPPAGSEFGRPSFDAVWYKWQGVSEAMQYIIRQRLHSDSPVKIAATNVQWRILPYQLYYPVLLGALGEEMPSWILGAMLKETQKKFAEIGVQQQ